ncbi:MAG TPA: glycosyl hydrolase family 18 protein [Limnochordales bacterium]|nr:glycosyl hydrolase family 18 protein [Limnochordales bacterium]
MTVQTILFLILSLLVAWGPFASGPQDDPADPAADLPAAILATVEGQDVALYRSPQERHPVAHLRQGDPLTVLAREAGWYRVRTADGQEGYVQDYLVRAVGPGRIPDDLMVLGYYMQDTRRPAWPALQGNTDVITAIAPWAWGLDPQGQLRPVYTSETHLADVLAFAGRRGVETHALIHNFNPDLGAFDARIVEALLTDPAVQRRAIQNIVDVVERWGMTGVHIDLENVPRAHRDALTAFMAALAAEARPRGLKVSMAVPAVTHRTVREPWTAAYDYAGLAPHVDFLMIMAYDQHWRGSDPGPVAALDWVREVVEYALDPAGGAVPPDKLVLGIPAYGYDWPAGTRWADAVAHADAMRRLAAAQARDPAVRLEWHARFQVPTFRYDGREVWFENHQSIGHKLLLALEYELAGVALWRLGQEDPDTWDLMRRALL